MKNTTSAILILGIIILINLLSKQFFFRLDFTEDKQYTLSKATKDLLEDLPEPVTVSAYFTEGLSPQYGKAKLDFQDLLIEYANRSKGMVDFEFIDPSEGPEIEEEAMKNQIAPLLISVRDKDQMTQKKAFMGALVKMGEQQDIIPLILPESAMEYALSTSIKKLSVVEKPSIGLIQGHGEAAPTDLAMVYQTLGILYTVETLNLAQETTIPDRFKTLAMIRPTDSIPPANFAKLDDFLARGGNLCIAMDAVNGDFSTAQGTAVTTGLETWLLGKGLRIEPKFIVDENCGTVSVQQRQGFFTMQTPVPFPYLPLIKTFADHPITKGVEQMMMSFASPISYVGDSAAVFTPLLSSSELSGLVDVPTYFDVANKQWTRNDFPMSNITVGGILSGNIVGNTPSRIVVYSDGDFPLGAPQSRGGQTPDNISLMVNSIDWLSDDTGLIELRTKGVASRPIDDLEDSTRSFYKYLNFFLPILLVIIYGVFRVQSRRSLRARRREESYV